MKNEHFGGIALRYDDRKMVITRYLLRNKKAKRRLRAKRKTIVSRRF